MILSSIFAVALLATAGWGVTKSMQSDANLSDLALANVEALADGESGGGTSVGYCYLEQTFAGTYGWKVFCNSETNANTIYPCEPKSYGNYLETSKDRCTK